MQGFKSIKISKSDIVSIAEKMKKQGHRLLMIHGHVDKEEKTVVTYQYLVNETTESYCVVGEKLLPTISHIYDLSAAWPEEELFELLGITFEGLNMRGRLFLPDTMMEGKGQIIVTPLSELRDITLGKKEAKK